MSVSYLITLYNKQDFIADVMDAVLAEQAVTGGEVIVYDDVSTDRSAAIVEDKVAGKNQIARLVRGDKNRGVGFATNALIKLASQPYTRLVDADDVLVRGSTVNMLRLAKEHQLSWIFGGTTEVGNEPPGLEEQRYAELLTLDQPVRSILRHTVAGASPSLFETQILKQIYPVPEWIKRTQDFMITLRVANKGVRIGYVKDIVSVGPSDRTGNNLSASLAAMFAEMSRDVAHDGKILPLDDLRYAARRYASRAAKYFRRRGQSKLSSKEKFNLWRYHNLGWLASREECIDRLNQSAEFLERDKNVLVTGPAGNVRN